MAFLLALAALTAPAPPAAGPKAAAPSLPAVASARATVRILPGARIAFEELSKGATPLAAATITLEDGTRQAARLVEFQ